LYPPPKTRARCELDLLFENDVFAAHDAIRNLHVKDDPSLDGFYQFSKRVYIFNDYEPLSCVGVTRGCGAAGVQRARLVRTIFYGNMAESLERCEKFMSKVVMPTGKYGIAARILWEQDPVINFFSIVEPNAKTPVFPDDVMEEMSGACRVGDGIPHTPNPPPLPSGACATLPSSSSPPTRIYVDLPRFTDSLTNWFNKHVDVEPDEIMVSMINKTYHDIFAHNYHMNAYYLTKNAHAAIMSLPVDWPCAKQTRDKFRAFMTGLLDDVRSSVTSGAEYSVDLFLDKVTTMYGHIGSPSAEVEMYRASFCTGPSGP
jgi:hypothetical protein